MKNEIELLLNSLKNINNENIIKNDVKELIELTETNLFAITSYREVYEYLQEKEESCPYKKLKQIERLFNGNWKKNWLDNTQRKYYPYFIASGGRLVFDDSGYVLDCYTGQVAYFKDEKTSTFVGKTFIDIYKEL